MASSAVPAARGYSESVFVNCPFDEQYFPLFDAVIFSVYDCGFFPRCSQEESDGGDIRLEKIVRLLKSCRYSIHDISRTQLDPKTNLPRFNMPFEFGIDMGLRHSEDGRWRDKKCIVMDTKRYRYQKFFSDISGQDPVAHGNNPKTSIELIRNWLKTVSGRHTVPGAAAIIERFRLFKSDLPKLSDRTPRNKITFADYASYASVWLEKRKAAVPAI